MKHVNAEAARRRHQWRTTQTSEFFWVERFGTLRREWQRITAFSDQSQAERFIETVAAGADVWTHLDGTSLPDAFMI